MCWWVGVLVGGWVLVGCVRGPCFLVILPPIHLRGLMGGPDVACQLWKLALPYVFVILLYFKFHLFYDIILFDFMFNVSAHVAL